MAKETHLHGKRDLLTWQKRHTYMAKETYLHGKRDLPLEAYVHDKRGLRTWQKRPAYMAKEACVHGKRGLRTWQKRPTYRGLRSWQKRPTYITKETYLGTYLQCVGTERIVTCMETLRSHSMEHTLFIWNIHYSYGTYIIHMEQSGLWHAWRRCAVTSVYKRQGFSRWIGRSLLPCN